MQSRCKPLETVAKQEERFEDCERRVRVPPFLRILRGRIIASEADKFRHFAPYVKEIDVIPRQGGEVDIYMTWSAPGLTP